MRDRLRRLDGKGSLTRIRVTGSGRAFRVQHGDDLPVTVTLGHYGLTCECRRPRCEHIVSLQMCGFVEPPEELREAA